MAGKDFHRLRQQRAKRMLACYRDGLKLYVRTLGGSAVSAIVRPAASLAVPLRQGSTSDEGARANVSPTPAHLGIRLKGGLHHHYVQVGSSGPPIVFLHGFLDSWWSFQATFERLERRFQLFAYDQRGHGDSEPATNYAISDFADDAVDFIERVVGSPAHLIGHSLGSIVAQRVAAARPYLVTKLVLIGGAATAADHPGLRDLQASLAEFTDVVPDEFVEAFQRSTVFAPISEDAIGAYIAESAKVGIAAWRGALGGLVDEPATSGAGSIAVPTLILWGEKDGVFDRDAQRALAGNLPDNLAINYPQVGHAPQWEIPDRVAGDIEKFLLASPTKAVS
ncbi:MAG: alpha/beta hydrolase [Mesorhizobium sp.]|uniref:alpha/beta fold hydrolase n=1 Tax=Mesorhizobium sp. TaxID=1871066 RepID=UPI000FE5C3E7|nr:MAG: alpha/beta hydrolase [Mesorhizobium sp.]